MAEMDGNGVPPRRALGYIRVSTGEQATNGRSLEVQEASVREWCQRRGWELAGLYRDARPGKSMRNRAGVRALLEAAGEGQATAVVVHRCDRFARNLRDLLNAVHEMRGQGVEFVSASEEFDTTTAVGMAMLQIAGVFAEMEHRRISERQRESVADRRARGRHVGRVPLGWRRDRRSGRLVPDPEGQAQLAEVRAFVDEHGRHAAARHFEVPVSTIRRWLASEVVGASANEVTA